MLVPSSDIVPGHNLDLSHGTGTRNPSEGRRVDRGVDTPQLRHVEKIGSLRAQIQRAAVSEKKRFVHGQVADERGRSSDRISSDVAELARCRKRKGRGIEPLGDSGISDPYGQTCSIRANASIAAAVDVRVAADDARRSGI